MMGSYFFSFTKFNNDYNKTRMKRLTIIASMMMAALVLVGCSKDEYKKDYNPLIDDPKEEQPTKPDEPAAQSGYDEQYRPQIHYTPANFRWVSSCLSVCWPKRPSSLPSLPRSAVPRA